MDDLTDEQIQFLAFVVLGEARGEGAEGMLAVSNVIRSRADSGIYPANPVDVASQPAQFTALDDGQFEAAQREAPVGSALYNTAERIVRGAIVDRTLPDITGRAVNYHSTAVAPYWSRGATTRWGTTQVGNHVFYARQPVPPGSIPDVLSLLDTLDARPSARANIATQRAEQALMRNRVVPSAPGRRPTTVGGRVINPLPAPAPLNPNKPLSRIDAAIDGVNTSRRAAIITGGGVGRAGVEAQATGAISARPIEREEIIEVNPMAEPPQSRSVYGDDSLGVVPVAARTFIGTILGNRENITERDFTRQEMLLLENAAARAEMNGRNYIHYIDYGMGQIERGSDAQTGDAILGNGMGSTQGSLAATLGRVAFKRDADGALILTDQYDFSPNSDYDLETVLRERGLPQVIMDNLKYEGLYGVAHLAGEMAVPPGKGRQVNIRIAPNTSPSGPQGRGSGRPVHRQEEMRVDARPTGPQSRGGRRAEEPKPPRTGNFSTETRYNVGSGRGARITINASSGRAQGEAEAKAGARADVKGSQLVRMGNTATAEGKAGAMVAADGEVTLDQPKTRTADSGLITYIRKTVPIGPNGEVLTDVPAVVKPSAKPAAPAARVNAAITQVRVATEVARMTAVAQSKVAWDNTQKPPVKVSGGAGPTPQILTKGGSITPSKATVAAKATAAAGALKAGAGSVTIGPKVYQPAGSVIAKPGAARMPETKVLTINPSVKEDVFRYVGPGQSIIERAPAPIPVVQPKLAAPVPLKKPSILRADTPGTFPKFSDLETIGPTRKFGEATIPASTKGDPVDFRKLAEGIDAERRRLTGEPALPRARPALAPTVPDRRPDTTAKTKLTAAPDAPTKKPIPQSTIERTRAVKPGPVSTQTVKSQPAVGPATLPTRRPDTYATAKSKVTLPRVIASAPIGITVKGGNRTFNPITNSVVPAAGTQSTDWQESSFQFTENSQLPSSMSRPGSNWINGY